MVAVPAKSKSGWKVWLERGLNVAAIGMLAWIVGRYVLPSSGEQIGGQPIDFLTGGKPVLLEFSQTHCPSCIVLRPVVDGIRRDYEGRATVKIYEIDRLNDYPEGDSVRKLSAKLGVRATPTFVILDSTGRPTKRFVGPTSGLSLRQALDQALGS